MCLRFYSIFYLNSLVLDAPTTTKVSLFYFFLFSRWICEFVCETPFVGARFELLTGWEVLQTSGIRSRSTRFFFFFLVVVGFVGFLVWVFRSGETALDKFHKISSPLRLHWSLRSSFFFYFLFDLVKCLGFVSLFGRWETWDCNWGFELLCMFWLLQSLKEIVNFSLQVYKLLLINFALQVSTLLSINFVL